MNCSKRVSDGEGKLFAEVFVCAECFIMAEALFNRLEGELKGLLYILKDRIREHLVQGKFHYNTSKSLDQLSKQDMMTVLHTLKEGTK
jgi:hypothetical protein